MSPFFKKIHGNKGGDSTSKNTKKNSEFTLDSINESDSHTKNTIISKRELFKNKFKGR